jgi:hypothetical protein
MRRALSTLLVLFFGIGPLALAIGNLDDASLPACCRRHGAHHCAMATDSTTQPAQSSAFTASAHCPMFPRGNASPSPVAAIAHAPLRAHDLLLATMQSVSAVIYPLRIYLRTPSLRGPPPSPLA